jgi:hypothetical protein
MKTGEKRCQEHVKQIGFTDFSTTHFQYFTRLITGPNSISSHVPEAFSPPLMGASRFENAGLDSG